SHGVGAGSFADHRDRAPVADLQLERRRHRPRARRSGRCRGPARRHPPRRADGGQGAGARLGPPRRVAAAAHARAVGERAVALARARRDAGFVTSADSVAAMFLQASAGGAVSLPDVLEAQRNAREALARYVDDLALANTAVGFVRLLDASEVGP